jgi:nitrate/nitrite transporter NarK
LFQHLFSLRLRQLLPEIKVSLNLTKAEVWMSNIWSMIGGVPLLFMSGPLSDKCGGRLMTTLLLALIAIPCVTGLVTTLNGLLFRQTAHWLVQMALFLVGIGVSANYARNIWYRDGDPAAGWVLLAVRRCNNA